MAVPMRLGATFTMVKQWAIHQLEVGHIAQALMEVASYMRIWPERWQAGQQSGRQVALELTFGPCGDFEVRFRGFLDL